jgi:uncharacterized protein (TIGR03437 family)
LRNGPVSPGQITLIVAAGIAPDSPVDLTLTPSAPLPRTLAGVQVWFDGEAAAIVSVNAGRVVVVTPYDVIGKPRVAVEVVVNGAVSLPVWADVLTDPSFLSRDGSGTGQAFALNPDGTQNSADNPAPLDSMVTLYETGVGQVAPSCPEGQVAAAASSGSVMTIPGYLCGVFQVQMRTPNYRVSTANIPNSPLTIAVK